MKLSVASLLAALLIHGFVFAQTAPASPPALSQAPNLLADQQALAQLRSRLPITSADDRLAAMASQAAAFEAQAQAVSALRARDLASLDQALQKLTPRGKRSPTAAERARAAPLLAQRRALAAQLGQAQAVAAYASGTFNMIAQRRREGFSARILQRTDSPFAPGFWSSLADSGGHDVDRLDAAADAALDAVLQAPEPHAAIGFGASLVIALLLLFPARIGLERLGRGKTAKSARQGLTRTAAAVWVAAVDIGLPTLAAAALHLGAQWSGLLSDKADALAGAAVAAVAWASAIVALGRILATDSESSRRLANLPDAVAERLRIPLVVVALVAAVGLLIQTLNFVIGASVAATIAANCVLSIAYAAVAGMILVSFGRSRVSLDPEAPSTPASPAWTLISAILSGVIVVTLGAVMVGFTTLAALVSGQIFWLSVIAAVAYLLLRLIDDLCSALFSDKGWAARLLFALFSLRRSAISQVGLLACAALQLVILIAALSLALTPFGQGGELLIGHLAKLGDGIHVGSATLSPGALLAGLATLIVGMGLAHVAQAWVNRRYLPVTDWDSGLRNSVSTGVGYLGAAIAVTGAFAATGLGFKQIALIISALSVGIGFGLQQIVQNFVSGIILLVERPVKVGDWVSLDGVEGDIRRIRVRATEIQTFDRSTVIVPNSDLITKPVQNKTLGEPRARVQLQVAIAKAADAPKAKDVILEAFRSNVKIMKNPDPAVYIDAVAAAGSIVFICRGYVENPRDAYSVRSELYFSVLEQFGSHAIAFPSV